MRIQSYLPIVRPLPIRTMPSRLLKKSLWLLKYSLGRMGAIEVGYSTSKNTLVKLKGNGPLGKRDSVLEIPKDEVIYESVMRVGSWDLPDSEFLASGLLKIAKEIKIKATNVALIDIGANSGLVCLQTMNIAKSQNSCFLFEPIPQHILAITNNLSQINDVKAYEFALSDRDGDEWIYTESVNHGNTSLFETAVPKMDRIKQKIRLVNTESFFQLNLMSFDRYVIKYDTQGMDALICSNIPDIVWQKTEFAIIEVWALPEINAQQVDTLLEKINHFRFMDWQPQGKGFIRGTEIRDFWVGKSGRSRNLYLKRLS
jgi:FkbM family methyltransferase